MGDIAVADIQHLWISSSLSEANYQTARKARRITGSVGNDGAFTGSGNLNGVTLPSSVMHDLRPNLNRCTENKQYLPKRRQVLGMPGIARVRGPQLWEMRLRFLVNDDDNDTLAFFGIEDVFDRPKLISLDLTTMRRLIAVVEIGEVVTNLTDEEEDPSFDVVLWNATNAEISWSEPV